LKIKALAGMPRKKAKFEILMNQQLTSAMGFIAALPATRALTQEASLFLCISETRRSKFRSKKC